MKMNTESNVYTIVYAVVMVIIVAVLLAVVNQGLKARQEANVRLDMQKQMLVALNQDLKNCDNPAALYDALVQDTLQMNADEKNADIIRFTVDGQTKYILRLHGQGLWGGIGGYLALNEDKNTIYGINFNHESETPGLGALIVEEDFRNQFKEKKIRKDGNIVSVAVMKQGKVCEAGADYQVDAVSGATITSTGVSDMLVSNLQEYSTFLMDSRVCPQEKASCNQQAACSQCGCDNCQNGCQDCCKDGCAQCCQNGCQDCACCNNGEKCCKDNNACCQNTEACCKNTDTCSEKKCETKQMED